MISFKFHNNKNILSIKCLERIFFFVYENIRNENRLLVFFMAVLYKIGS